MKKWLKRQIIMMKNYVCINKRYTHLYIIAGFFIIAGTIAGFAYSFALPEEISEVVIDSDNYGGLGSYRVKKSASWIETNQAKITFDFDSIQKTSDKRYDVILVLDTSASMFGDKLSKLKEDSKELVKYILKDSYNRVGLISFQKTSNILSGFTNDEEAILHIINGLSADGSTNYYDALVNADTILNDYQLEDNKECILLFLTDGYPNVKTPNEVGEYQYLKSEYPFLKINAVQYEMGNDILEPITKISDKQFVADMENLHNVLFDASIEVTSYERIEIVDYINSEYFYVKDEKDIHPSVGTVKLENEGGKQKVIWIIDNIPSGVKTSLEIVVEVKKSSIETEDVVYMPTNEKEIVTTKLENEEEKVQESNLTPILKNYYDVIYDLNLPDTCDMKSIPSVKYLYGVSVPINDDLSNCGNYRFEGWDMITSNVKIYNDDSFVMPNEDVLLRAVWSKMGIVKSMEGSVYTAPDPIIQEESYVTELWKYKENITKVVFQDDYYDIANVVDTWDLSAEDNYSVVGKLIKDPNDDAKYIAYIQGNGKVIANQNSDLLFAEFTSLKVIEGLEYFDTSNATTMHSMFYNASALTTLDLSHFNTSNVKEMSNMFAGMTSLTTLDLSHFDTSKVTAMSNMFFRDSSLENVNLSSFDTSNVSTMEAMFYRTSALRTLDLSNFDTSSVTIMKEMFCGSGVTGLNLSNFDTSRVTDMSLMFRETSSLKTLNLSNFNTSNVLTMSQMFYESGIENVNLSSFETPKVTDMSWMFTYAASLENLDFRKATFDQVSSVDYMFDRCPNTIKIVTKNATTKTWLQERLSVSYITGSTVTTVE